MNSLHPVIASVVDGTGREIVAASRHGIDLMAITFPPANITDRPESVGLTSNCTLGNTTPARGGILHVLVIFRRPVGRSCPASMPARLCQTQGRRLSGNS